MQRLYLGYGIVGLVVMWLAFGFGGQLLTNMIGFVYPAYCSIQALESNRKQDDIQWLTYWVVFAAFSVLEYFAGKIQSFIQLTTQLISRHPCWLDPLLLAGQVSVPGLVYGSS